MNNSKPVKSIDTDFIFPSLKIFNSFKEAEEDYNKGDDLFFRKESIPNIQVLLSNLRNIVIAEPGFGKTTLLKNLIYETKKNWGIFLDLKKLRNKTLKNLIKESTEDPSAIKTTGFKLSNSSDVIVALDALDEVAYEDFSHAVDEIKKFCAEHPKVTIFISSRWHYFKKNQEVFSNIDFCYLRLLPFSKEQAEVYLKKYAFSEADIRRIFHALSFQNRPFIIQTPRYLKLLVSYVQENDVSDAKDITKTSLFEYFIYKKLELEDKKRYEQKRDFIKRVLEKLALVMEIYQKNVLTKDELLTFFDDIESDIKINLLNQISIETLFDKTVLKDNGDSIEFENTEFQEYLAAKEILRLGNPLLVIREIAIDAELQEIYPSWFNTLGFVIDLDIHLLRPLLKFGEWQKSSMVIDEEFHRFLTSIGVDSLSDEDKDYLFKAVFEHYQDVSEWIRSDIARSLALYYSPKQESLLRSYSQKRKGLFKSETERFVQLGNVAETIGYLFERGVLQNESYWKTKLVKYALDDNDNSVLQRNALTALVFTRDTSVLKKVAKVWDSGNRLIRESFLHLCKEIDSENSISIQYFIEGTKNNYIPARYGFYEIESNAAIKVFLQALVNDEQFLSDFIDRESIFKDKDHKIIENIENVIDDEVCRMLKSIIIAAFKSKHWYNFEHSEFIHDIANLLKSRNRDYIFELIADVKRSSVLKRNLFGIQGLFASILEKDQVDDFIDKLSSLEHGKRAALLTLQHIKFSKKLDAKDIYEAGRRKLDEEYNESEERWKKQKEEKSRNEVLYREFQIKLEPEKNKYYPEVFRFLIQHKNQLFPFITEVEFERLKNLITDSVLEKFDPGEQKLKIGSRDEGRTTYTTNAWIHIFGDALVTAKELEMTLPPKYRQKIINYIPFAYDNHERAILHFVKNIKKTEAQKLLRVYSEKKSDLWQFMPSSLIRASKQYNLKEAAPILKEFVVKEDFLLHDRIEALSTWATLKPEVTFLRSTFNKYKASNSSERGLADKANESLIENFKDDVAINWRFSQIKKRAFKFQTLEGVHSISGDEEELHSREFGKVITRLDKKYIPKFLDLLKKSFDIYAEDSKMYASYANYIWNLTLDFFDNLKKDKSYEPLKELEKFIHENAAENGANWFLFKLKELKRSYLIYIGKPSDFSGCIKAYNNLKSQKYLDITHPEQLLDLIRVVLNNDFAQWAKSDGIKLLSMEGEVSVQKIIRINLEKFFFRRGFQIRVLQEPHLLSDKRTDFFITYGFIGPVIIEIKLAKSSDLIGSLEKKDSYASMRHYMNAYGAHAGIFYVLNNQEINDRWKDKLKKVEESYNKIEGVTVISLNLFPDE